MRRAILAAFLAVGLLILEVVGDASFSSRKRVWTAIENVVNFPGYFVLHIVGPGHGLSQLVLPMLFVFFFYLVLFWLVIALVEQLRKKSMLFSRGNDISNDLT